MVEITFTLEELVVQRQVHKDVVVLRIEPSSFQNQL